MRHFANPNNLVVTLDDMQGLLAFLFTVPGWRTQLWAARFSREWRWPRPVVMATAQLAVLTLDVLAIDAFIDPENVEAMVSAPRWGMQQRGYIHKSVQYNGVWRPAWWFEIHRDALGVPQPPLEATNGVDSSRS